MGVEGTALTHGLLYLPFVFTQMLLHLVALTAERGQKLLCVFFSAVLKFDLLFFFISVRPEGTALRPGISVVLFGSAENVIKPRGNYRQ
jgi:energy-coupling factor transporter transmembrane protein EcfT